MHEKTTEYRLRNQPEISFSVRATCTGGGTEGAVARAHVCRVDGLKFRYEVRFQGEFCATKANFDDEMYLETALSLIKSQIESHRYEDSQIVVEVNSGMPRTRLGVKLEGWD